MFTVLVSFQVTRKLGLPRRVPGTEVTLVRLLAGVDANMPDQVAFVIEGSGAVVALVRTLARVGSLVFCHIRAVTCSIATHKALPHVLGRDEGRATAYDDHVCKSQNRAFSANNGVNIGGQHR